MILIEMDSLWLYFMIMKIGDAPIKSNTSFENLPDDWAGPVCGVGKYVEKM